MQFVWDNVYPARVKADWSMTCVNIKWGCQVFASTYLEPAQFNAIFIHVPVTQPFRQRSIDWRLSLTEHCCPCFSRSFACCRHHHADRCVVVRGADISAHRASHRHLTAKQSQLGQRPWQSATVHDNPDAAVTAAAATEAAEYRLGIGRGRHRLAVDRCRVLPTSSVSTERGRTGSPGRTGTAMAKAGPRRTGGRVQRQTVSVMLELSSRTCSTSRAQWS